MPVLAQNVSLILKASVVSARIPKLREVLASEFPLTYCCDDELVRVGFGSVREADSLAIELTANRVVGCAERDSDMALVIEGRGCCDDCDWIDYGLLDIGNPPTVRVEACRLVGSNSLELAAPPSWSHPT